MKRNLIRSWTAIPLAALFATIAFSNSGSAAELTGASAATAEVGGELWVTSPVPTTIPLGLGASQLQSAPHSPVAPPRLPSEPPGTEDITKILKANGIKLSPTAVVKIVITVPSQREVYYVVEYQNSSTSPVGIAIVSQSGALVTDKAQASTILRPYAWIKASKGLTQQDLGNLRNILSFTQSLESAGSAAADTERTISAVLAEIDKLKGLRIPIVGSVWDILTRSVTGLDAIDGLLRSLRDGLRSFSSGVQSVNSNLPVAIRQIEGMQAGQSADYSRIGQQIDSAMLGMSTLQKSAQELAAKVDSVLNTTSQIERGLRQSSYAGAVAPAADALGQLNRQIGGVAGGLKDTASRLGTAAKSMEALLAKERETEQSLLKQWSYRPGALGIEIPGGPVGALAGLGLVAAAVLTIVLGRVAVSPRVAPVMATLQLQTGSDAGRVIPIRKKEMNVGRSDDNDVVLADKEISRKHAVIKLAGGRYVMQDMNSTNGTLVNGKRVTVCLLEDGDEVKMGTTRMTFRIQGH